MKCPDCGAEIPPSSKKCSNCGKELSSGFNYQNMEHELLNTVLEEENISAIKTPLAAKSAHAQPASEPNENEEEDGQEAEVKKQPLKLAAALFLCAAVCAGLVCFLNERPADYVYGKTETEYMNCLALMSQEKFGDAFESADLLLKEEPENLKYLALKNTICQNLDDTDAQKKVLHKIISLDTDNYQAYEQLLQIYLDEENQAEIVKLEKDAPNNVISDMLKENIVDVPFLVLTPGVYDSSQELEISSEKGHRIFYTLDGSSPKKKGRPYTTPILLEEGRYTVTAVCQNEKGIYGEESSADYQIGTDYESSDSQSSNSDEPLEPPSVYPESGMYSTPQLISIDVPIGYSAYYTWEQNTDLTPENGTLYAGGIEMPEGSSVLSVILADGNGNHSEVKQVSYRYQP